MQFKKIILLLAIFSILLSSLAVVIGDTAAENDCIYYFYGEECDGCKSLEPYFSDLTQKYPDLEIKRFDVYHNLDDYLMLNDYLKAYKVPGGNLIPVVFISGSYFVGEESITNFLEQRIKDNEDSQCPALEDKAVGIIGKGEPQNVLATLTFSVMSREALKNLIQPGIIVLLLIFLSLLALIKDRKDIVNKSLLFITGLYLAYFCFGLGVFDWMYNPTIYKLFYKFIGFIGIVFGLINIRLFFGGWKKIVKIADKAPADLKKYLGLIYNYSLSSPGVFIVGFLASLFTFMGVSDKYYLLRNLFAEGFMRSAVLPLVIYYDLVLILIFIPLFLVFNYFSAKSAATAGKKSSPKEVKTYERHYAKLLNFAAGIIVLILGMVLLFW